MNNRSPETPVITVLTTSKGDEAPLTTRIDPNLDSIHIAELPSTTEMINIQEPLRINETSSATSQGLTV